MIITKATINGESLNSFAGLLFVAAIHAVLLYVAWSYRLLPVPEKAMTLFVDFYSPPPVQKKPEPQALPPPRVKHRPVTAPPPSIMAANTPIVSPNEPVAPQPLPVPLPPVDAPPVPAEPGPAIVATSAQPTPVVISDLSVICPERTPAEYPPLSRRLGEHGQVVLRVELDDSGRVASAKVKESSGHPRLDEAGLAAVKKWQCNAPTRNGETVRAVAMQPFNFVLEGRR